MVKRELKAKQETLMQVKFLKKINQPVAKVPHRKVSQVSVC